LDTGAGYELRINRMGAIAVMAGAIVATILVWAPILLTMARH
jgi:succinate dehydrogenase / fumarate reductase cytochrome b subunit